MQQIQVAFLLFLLFLHSKLSFYICNIYQNKGGHVANWVVWSIAMETKDNYLSQQPSFAQQTVMVLLPQVVVENMMSELNEIKQTLRDMRSGNNSDEFIESENARKMLGICQKTWQTYRDRRLIPFIQIGRKIYVKRSDLESFMAEHYISAK